MPRTRRKLSAALHDFGTELRRLERFDAQNQTRFSAASKQKSAALSKSQLHFLTEAIFFKGYRAYETFARDSFLLYCLDNQPRCGAPVTSFLNPKNFIHAEQLIQSSMRFLDWTEPDEIIRRAELYLQDGFPFKIPYTMHRDALSDYRRIRNHIAHNSKESLTAYIIVLRKHYGTTPLSIPTPGEFLLVNDTNSPNKYKLLVFVDLMHKLANDLT